MSRTVVILLSDKRSGSTMLQDELCKHPDIQHVDYSPHTYFETHHWLKAAVLLGMPAQTYYGHRVYAGYGSKKNARTYLIDCVRRNVPDFRVPECDRELVFQGWEALCGTFATPVFFEKSPQHIAQWAALSLMLEWIQNTDFRVRVIGLVRNPHGVLASASKLFLSDGQQRQFGWADMHRNLLAFRQMLPEDAFHLVRYEDVLADPGQTFQQILRFLGVCDDSQVGQGVRQSSLEKWRQDPQYCVQLHATVRQIAAHFGYTEADLDNLEKTPPSRRQRLALAYRRFASRQRSRLVNGIVKPLILRTKAGSLGSSKTNGQAESQKPPQPKGEPTE